MTDVGVGIVGTGYIAKGAHGPAVTETPGARLAGVLSRSESAGREFLSTFDASDAKAYDDLGAFLADPGIGLVVVASPDGLHFAQAEASLRAGKHVVVEKPMALSMGEARTLVDLADSGGLVLAAGYHLRCHVGHQLLRERVLGGELGTLRHVRVSWPFPIAETNWRAQGEVAKWWSLSATGTHCLDLARWYADDMADWAQFRSVLSNSKWHARSDEAAVIAAQLASGPTVDVLSAMQFDAFTRLELFGDHGSAVAENTFGSHGGGEITVNGERLAYTPENPFERQLAGVLAAIAGQGPPPADGAVGLRAVEDLVLADDR
ncbi:Gfo/Idh/MocA family protein [Asanoa iriomotensis]|uniref:Oxidoreductase n=1 Tax=Asanoa iriomotensis TaxID=234613 RepID=A0ABQ4BU98_9ACTN|nr:Gfo/Idh/MocA family oxidoreductase [Asanoa iriomotensis]GIF54104.1 oxidoreductase [Asanoa iriomotensis]